jgi:ABC-type branched-subunit amino acid transport system substrate-binding protein
MRFQKHGTKRARVGLLLAGATLLLTFTPTVAFAAHVANTLSPASKSSLNVEQINLQSIPGIWDDSGGLQAYFNYVNAHGGVDGHKINVTECYAGSLISSSPNEATTCAQQAVANHSLALVGSFNDYDSNILPIVSPSHIADFGNFPASAVDSTSADSYPLLVPDVIFDAGLGAMLVQEGHCKTVGVIAVSGTATEVQAVNATNAGTKWAGGKVVPAVLVSATETDFAPAVATIESEGGACIADETAGTSSVALVTAASQSGQTLKIAGIGPTFSPATIAALGPLANGLYIDQTAQELAQVTDAGYHTPQEKLFDNLMQQYEPSDIPLGNSEWPCYESAAAFVIVAKYMAANGISFTPSNFEKAIPKVNLATGFFAPVDFATKGPIPGYPRIHAVSLNYLIVQDDTIVPISHRNINVAQALIKYPNG